MVWRSVVFPCYIWIDLRMYGILRKILTHELEFRTDFWYLYGFFGSKIRMENFLFPDNEFFVLGFLGPVRLFSPALYFLYYFFASQNSYIVR